MKQAEDSKEYKIWLSIDCKYPSSSKKKRWVRVERVRNFSKNGIYIKKEKDRGFPNKSKMN